MRFALAALMAVSLVGCTDKSPEGVCKKMEALGKAAGKTGGKMAQCVMFLSKIKSETPKQYACMADCIHGASDTAGTNGCYKSCQGNDDPGATAKKGGAGASSAPRKMSRAECKAIAARITSMAGIRKYNKTAADIARARERYTNSCNSGRFSAKARKKYRCLDKLARAGQPYDAIASGACR